MSKELDWSSLNR